MCPILNRAAKGKTKLVDVQDVSYARGIKPVSTTKNSMRNQPCPCGSRKKYKKCCWSKVMS